MSDLIRREDAIKVAKSFLRNDDEWFQEALASQIRMIPSAESTGDLDNAIYEYVKEGLMDNPYDRPQGEWLIFDGESDLYVDIKCSYCRKVYTVDSYKRDDIGFTIEDLKFCPNCGARMKGADDE